MSLLIFGKTGQLGKALTGSGIRLGRDEVDLTDPEACADAIHRHRPSAVINAAAYTQVDQAETEEPLAHQINARAPGAMARAAAAIGVPFVTVSTDYVFDGTGSRPWKPNDPIAPINAYGRSKAAGEQEIAQAGGVFAIIRTSWVISGHGRNFLTTMLRLGKEKSELGIVGDQIGGPTPAAALAALCIRAAEHLATTPGDTGIYHFSGAPDASWADLARAVMSDGGLDCTIDDIATRDYPTPARRPLNSRLDCSRTTAVFGSGQPDWRSALPGLVQDARVPAGPNDTSTQENGKKSA